MSCAAIMVHVDAEGELPARLSLARGLAERLECELIGVSSWMPRPVFIADNVMIDAPPDEQLTQAIEEALRKQKAAFLSAMVDRGGQAQWSAALDFPTSFVARESCAADFIVVGRDASPFDVHRNTDAGALALQAGRPVLVAPSELTTLALDHVLVAWKDTREARRAVRDAVPLLRQARAVTVVEIAESSNESDEPIRVATYLKQHGIAAKADRVQPRDGIAGEIILREAAARSCDLIVAGAYGHSRLGEWLFGGVTRHLLTASPVTCLLSH